MAAYSYSPHGNIEPNLDYETCCRTYHATVGNLKTAAKFFSCYFFILCLLISGTNFLIFGFDHTWINLGRRFGLT
uniref:Uncharacterized protein n=1 Tax=Heterorhabditis bacteriophora TaxID=37862 RepID=A0A1I7WPT9_HETBA